MKKTIAMFAVFATLASGAVVAGVVGNTVLTQGQETLAANEERVKASMSREVVADILHRAAEEALTSSEVLLVDKQKQLESTDGFIK